MRASIYIRRSKQADARNLSLEGMRSEAIDHLTRLGYEVASVHVDNGVSGEANRETLEAWLREDVDCLGSYHTDRLTREGVNVAAKVLDRVEGKGDYTSLGATRLVTVDGLDSEDEDGFRWRFVIAAENARSELRRIKKRNKDSYERLKKAGRHPAGAAPYGTKVVDGYLAEEPVEAEILREAAQRVLRGEAPYAVVRWMNQSGYKTRRGNEWTRPSLLKTLRSEPTRKHVLGAAMADAVVEALRPKRTRKPGRPITHMLANLAVCGGCGRKVTTRRDTRRPHTYYVCGGSSAGTPCEQRARIRVEEADEVVERDFLATWGPHHWYEEVVEIDGSAREAAQGALDQAQVALLADATPEALATYQEARAALEAAPEVKRTSRLVPTKTYADQWGESDAAGRRSILSNMAFEIVLSGTTRTGQEVQTTWLKDVE